MFSRSLRTFILVLALLSTAGCLHTGGTSPSAVEDGSLGSLSKTGISVNVRPGVSVNMVLVTPSHPHAALVMLPGGPGLADISGTDIGIRRGFVGANAESFASYGLAVAVIDAASDQSGGMLPGYRQTTAHLTEVDAVIARIKKEAGLPVWMLGISRSTLSIMHVAVNTKVGMDGLIVLSSVTNIPPYAGVINVMDVGLERIRVPALVVAHEDDGCRGTPSSGADKIVGRLTNSPKAVVKLFSGGFTEGGNPCLPGSHHTFNSIQDQVVTFIARFIKANTHTE